MSEGVTAPLSLGAKVLSDTQDPKTPSIQIGPPTLTRFELARILGARALQVSMGAPVLFDLDDEGQEESDPLLIAEAETKKGILPISIRRILPDGRYQDIPMRWLLKKGRTRRSTRST